MKTLYVRIKPKTGADGFFRCGTKFTKDWRLLLGVDDATAKRLQEEQMLEVSEDEPSDFDAGSSSVGEGTAPGDAARTGTTANEATDLDGGSSAAGEGTATNDAAQTATTAKSKKGGN